MVSVAGTLLSLSFAALMLYAAGGDVVDMDRTLQDFGVQRLKSVREYLASVPSAV